jgi:hypothetical protein
MPLRKKVVVKEEPQRKDPKSQSLLNVDIFELGVDPETATKMRPSVNGVEKAPEVHSGVRKKKSPRKILHQKHQQVEEEDDDDEDYEDIELPEEDISDISGRRRNDDDSDEDITMVGEESTDSDIAKAIFALLGDKDFRTKSELSDQDIKDLTLVTHVARRYHCRALLQIVSDFCHFRVSLDRGSRKEVVDAFAGMSQFRTQNSPDGQLLQKLRGNV